MEQERVINPIPPAVLVLALLMVGIELVMQLATAGLAGGAQGVGWRADTINDFGFFPAIQHEMFARGTFPFDYLYRYVTYPFVHSSLMHAGFAAVITLAVGKFVGDRWHSASVVTVFFSSAIVAAVIFGLIAPENWPYYGGYPAVYGLIGAFSHIMWVRLGQQGANRWKAFSMIGILLVIQIIWGLFVKLIYLMGYGGDATPMMLYLGISEFAGFATGLILSPLVGPGGWQGFLARIRQR